MSDQDSNYQNRAISATGILTLSVRNWEKHNPRHDRPNLQWFKMSTGFFMDHEVALLSKDATYVLMYCLTEQGKSGSKPFKLSIHLAALIVKMKTTEFVKSIQELQIAGFIEVGIESATIGNQTPTSGNQTPTTGCLDRVDRKDRIDPVGVPPPDPTEALILKYSKIHADEDWVRLEHKRASSWYAERGKKFTERAFGNWLRRGLDGKPLPQAARPVFVEKYWDAERNEWLPVPPRNDP